MFADLEPVRLAVTDEAAATAFALPISPTLTAEDQALVVDVVAGVGAHA